MSAWGWHACGEALDALSDPRHVIAVALEGERGRERVVGMCTGFAYSHPDKPRQLFVAR